MPLGSLLVHCSGVVNDCDEPVTVLPNVENHVSLHIVGILERAANFQEIVPSPCGDGELGLGSGACRFEPYFSAIISSR